MAVVLSVNGVTLGWPLYLVFEEGSTIRVVIGRGFTSTSWGGFDPSCMSVLAMHSLRGDLYVCLEWLQALLLSGLRSRRLVGFHRQLALLSVGSILGMLSPAGRPAGAGHRHRGMGMPTRERRAHRDLMP